MGAIAAIVATLLTVMATKFFESLGTAAGKHLFDLIAAKFQESGKGQVLQPFLQGNPTGTDEQEVRNELVTEMNKDPSFIPQVVTAVNELIQDNPRFFLANIENVLASLAQDIFGLSDAQSKVGRGITNPCPIGGETMFPSLWPRYMLPDGTPIEGAPFTDYFSLPRSAVAQCPRGHQWSVFAIQLS
jgi:hypothetical protein